MISLAVFLLVPLAVSDPRSGQIADIFVFAILALALNVMVGYTGLHDYYSRKNGDGPVDFRVFVDEAKALDVRHKNDDGWRRFLASHEL